MKTLYILRHAKSSWDTPEMQDHERPLNKRGRQTAPKMGKLMRKKKKLPDLVLCSTAERARQTAELVTQASSYKGRLEYLPDFYGAPADVYLKELAKLGEAVQSVMVIGHNPGLEELLQELTGKYEPLPTASLAEIRLPIQSWEELLDEAAGELVYVWRPKEI